MTFKLQSIQQKYNYANGTLESRFSLPQPQPYKLPEQTFTYDNDNRIATHNGSAVTYDDDGNLLHHREHEDTEMDSLYNARNQLMGTTSLCASVTSVVNYSYDVLGNRIRQITNNSITNNYVVNPVSSLSQVLTRDKNGIKTYYVYGLGLEYEVSQSGSVRYYHYDQIGSTVALSDGAGQVTDRMEYSPYGTITYRTGTNDTLFLYVGKYGVQTDANGLLYMRARYYSPVLRRFINSDPIGLTAGPNLFAYAGGDPISSIDPQGLWDERIHFGSQEYGGTLQWAQDTKYFSESQARIIATADQAVDSGRTAPWPVIGDQSRHFNTDPNAQSGSANDTRIIHAKESLSLAINLQLRANEFLRANDLSNYARYTTAAMEALGTGLHSLQDVSAHIDRAVERSWLGFYHHLNNMWCDSPESPKDHPELGNSEGYIKTKSDTLDYFNGFIEGVENANKSCP